MRMPASSLSLASRRCGNSTGWVSHPTRSLGASWRTPQLVDDQEPVVGQLLLQSQEPTLVARFHEFVDQRRGGDEAHRERLLARGQSQPQCGVRLARTAQPGDILMRITAN